MGAHPGHPPHGGGDHQQPATHASLTRIPRLGNAGSSFLEGCHPGGSGCLLWLDRRVWDLSQRLPSPADSLDWPALPPHCPRACSPTSASQHHYSRQEVPTLDGTPMVLLPHHLRGSPDCSPAQVQLSSHAGCCNAPDSLPLVLDLDPEGPSSWQMAIKTYLGWLPSSLAGPLRRMPCVARLQVLGGQQRREGLSLLRLPAEAAVAAVLWLPVV